MIALWTALTVATAAPTPSLSDAQHTALMQQLRLQCRDADIVLPTFAAGLKAQQTEDLATAKSDWEAIISDCGVSPASQPPRVFRAEIAWREKDYAGVLSWLKDTPRVGPSRLDLMASMLAMSADRQLGDEVAFMKERDLVETADARALTSEGERLGDFEVMGARVTAYAVHLAQGNFLRLMAFTVSPADPTAMPESVMLTDDLAARSIAKQTGAGQGAPYFLDAYTCLTHVTIKLLPGHGDQPPTYDEVKPWVASYLKDHTWTSSQTRPAEVACAWPQYVAPGLTK